MVAQNCNKFGITILLPRGYSKLTIIGSSLQIKVIGESRYIITLLLIIMRHVSWIEKMISKWNYQVSSSTAFHAEPIQNPDSRIEII